MQQGTFRLLHGSGAENAFQPLVHLTHPVGGGCQQCIQEYGSCSHVLAGPCEGGGLPLHLLIHRGLAYLQRCFVLGPISQPCLHGCPLTGRPALMLHSPSLDVVLRSVLSSLRMSHQLLREGF
jgi:hypothetical protein